MKNNWEGFDQWTLSPEGNGIHFLDFENCKGKPPQHLVSSMSLITCPKYSQNYREAGFQILGGGPMSHSGVFSPRGRGLRTESCSRESTEWGPEGGKPAFLWRAPTCTWWWGRGHTVKWMGIICVQQRPQVSRSSHYRELANANIFFPHSKMEVCSNFFSDHKCFKKFMDDPKRRGNPTAVIISFLPI